MLTVGVDAHKRVHVAVAVDDAGQELSQWRGPNSAAGWQSLREWAANINSGPCQWGIEGAWNCGRGLAQQLVAAGHIVTVRHRLNRGGNRRLNALLHMMAITQLRCWAPAKEYLARRIAEGKTRREATRALKRYLARAVWRAWKRCLVDAEVDPEARSEAPAQAEAQAA